MKRRPFIMQTTQFHAPLGPFKRGALEIWKAEEKSGEHEEKKMKKNSMGRYIFP